MIGGYKVEKIVNFRTVDRFFVPNTHELVKKIVKDLRGKTIITSIEKDINRIVFTAVDVDDDSLISYIAIRC